MCPKCQTLAENHLPEGGRFKLEMSSTHALLSIVGSVHNTQELEELQAQIDGIQTQQINSIAFAFLSSSYLISGMINLLVKTLQTLSLQGKPTFVITKDAPVLESLRVMNLDGILRIFPDLEKYHAALD